jgi:hypothetical protein
MYGVQCVRSEGHHRDECPTLGNYMEMGAPNPFPVGPHMEWCEICRQWGHIPPHFPTLEKYQKTHHTPFCEFCKSMGHDVNNCRSLQLMQDHTHDVFQVQEEQKGGDHGGVERGGYQGGPRGGYGCGWDEDMEEGEVDPPLVLTVVR